MPRFTPDNTEGYAPADLELLNQAYEFVAVDADDIDDEMERKSFLDHVAESLLTRFDSGKRTLEDLLTDPAPSSD